MAARIALASAAVLRCVGCGRRFANPAANEGAACPECGSRRLSSVSLWGGSLEYALADRSQGYALEDIRFGRLAQWAGLLSLHQYTEGLGLQRQRLGLRQGTPSLAQILIERGYLSKRQVEAVLRARVAAWQDGADDQFGKLAMERNLLTQAQYLASRQLQLDLSAKAKEVPPLPLVVYEKRFMQEKEIVALLKVQQLQGEGLLSFVDQQLEHKGPPLRQVLLGAKGSSGRTVRLVAAALALTLAGLLAWRLGAFSAAMLVQAKCIKCNYRTAAPLRANWKPLPCRKCGALAVYPEAICEKCGEIFAVEAQNPYGQGVHCPKCGSDFYKLLTREVNVEEVRKAIKDKPKPGSAEPGKLKLTDLLEGAPR